MTSPKIQAMFIGSCDYIASTDTVVAQLQQIRLNYLRVITVSGDPIRNVKKKRRNITGTKTA